MSHFKYRATVTVIICSTLLVAVLNIVVPSMLDSGYLPRYLHTAQNILENHTLSIKIPTTEQVGAQLNVTAPTSSVLLVTHYRGGSSFFGELFKQNEKFLYWFEPLKMYNDFLYYLKSDNATPVLEGVYYKAAKHSVIPLPERLTANRTHHLMAFLTCDANNMVMEDYTMCREVASNDECVTKLGNQCKDAEVIAVKTIWIAMYFVQYFLDAIPGLKVIYFTRDPRGILNSRRRLRSVNAPMLEAADNLCLRMLADYRIYTELLDHYPGRIMWLKYEDLATDPLTHARYIYRFINHRMPPNLKTWIIQNTNMSPSKHEDYDTKRNSSYTVQRWREDLKPEVIDNITDICALTLHELGYPG